MATIDIIDGVNWVFLKVSGTNEDPSALQRLRDELFNRGYLAVAEVDPHNSSVKVRLHHASHYQQMSSDVKALGDHLYST